VLCASPDGGRLFGVGPNIVTTYYNLTSYNRNTGAMLWQRNTVLSYFYNDLQDAFYFTFPSSSNKALVEVVEVDAKTGATLSSGQLPSTLGMLYAVNPVGNHPIFLENPPGNDVAITEVDQTTWVIRWRQVINVAYLGAIPLVMTEDGILIANLGNYIHTIDCKVGEVLWKSAMVSPSAFALQNVSTASGRLQEHLVVLNSTGLLVLDITTGRQLASSALALGNSGGMITVGEDIIFTGADAQFTNQYLWKVAYKDMARLDSYIHLATICEDPSVNCYSIPQLGILQNGTLYGFGGAAYLFVPSDDGDDDAISNTTLIIICVAGGVGGILAIALVTLLCYCCRMKKRSGVVYAPIKDPAPVRHARDRVAYAPINDPVPMRHVRRTCGRCGGSGRESSTCPTCEGHKGVLFGTLAVLAFAPCEKCQGSGTVESQCSTCYGSGTVY